MSELIGCFGLAGTWDQECARVRAPINDYRFGCDTRAGDFQSRGVYRLSGGSRSTTSDAEVVTLATEGPD